MFLTHEALIALTKRRRFAAQVRRLQQMGVPIVRLRPDGSPVVLQADLAPAHPPRSNGPRVRDP